MEGGLGKAFLTWRWRICAKLPVLPKSTSSHPEKKSKGGAARIQGASAEGLFDGLGKGDQNDKITKPQTV